MEGGQLRGQDLHGGGSLGWGPLTSHGFGEGDWKRVDKLRDNRGTSRCGKEPDGGRRPVGRQGRALSPA